MQEHHLQGVISPVVEEQGLEVVRILTIGDSNPTLQIMVEHKNYEQEITVDDCAKVSRALSVMFEENDPFDNRYTLEVSSPGLDRPLTKLSHFERYVGYEIKLEVIEMVEKRKRFKGKIISVVEDVIALQMDETEYKIAFNNINKAKVVITDELWASYLKSNNSIES